MRLIVSSLAVRLCDRDVKELGSMKVGRLCFAGTIKSEQAARQMDEKSSTLRLARYGF